MSAADERGEAFESAIGDAIDAWRSHVTKPSHEGPVVGSPEHLDELRRNDPALYTSLPAVDKMRVGLYLDEQDGKAPDGS